MEWGPGRASSATFKKAWFYLLSFFWAAFWSLGCTACTFVAATSQTFASPLDLFDLTVLCNTLAYKLSFTWSSMANL